MKWTIGSKIPASFGLIIGLVVVSSIFIITKMNEFNYDLENYKNHQVAIKTASDLQLNVSQVWQFMTDAALTRDKQVLGGCPRTPSFKATFCQKSFQSDKIIS